ncbi:hypothetical protein Fmac_021127 [Flemingia macrophylla]|uniref:Uncharacterized protein n=1 Tax=Flemingia macrophylla TaxID=520843 RepID=A0ABD1LW12_9FABA
MNNVESDSPNQVGLFRRGRTVKGKRQPPICKKKSEEMRKARTDVSSLNTGERRGKSGKATSAKEERPKCPCPRGGIFSLLPLHACRETTCKLSIHGGTILMAHCIYPKWTLHESSVCTSLKLVLQRLKKLRCSKGCSLQVLPSQVTWLKRRRREQDTVAEGHPRWLPEGSSHAGGSAIGKGKRRRKLHASHNRLCMGA